MAKVGEDSMVDHLSATVNDGFEVHQFQSRESHRSGIDELKVSAGTCWQTHSQLQMGMTATHQSEATH